ncbi:hypothetical protein L6164_005360 [Bauhinia variegata]|uniref:Uncharacterized protein n=1 Tax=Bauhinia variegata TaxID=167791 RepID=A0ACB9PR24_BAUVA|nr:hypothetical protein L6164_005360 [Bauhinia variegata]
MADNYSSDSDDEITLPRAKLFEHDRSIHEILGGGLVADVLLWKRRNVSAGILLGMTLLWYLFEVVEYNFLPLLCHISITTLLVLFIWCTVADLLKWNRPKIPEIIVHESYFLELAFIFYKRFNQFLQIVLYISCGADLPRFLLVVFCLYVVSVIGSCFNFVNLLYIGFLCIQTLPIVYEKYEEEINSLAGALIQDVRKKYRWFDKRYLGKIPRGPIKEKKTR